MVKSLGDKPERANKTCRVKNFSTSKREPLKVRANSTKEEIQKFIEFCIQNYRILKMSPYNPNKENSRFHVFVDLEAKESGDDSEC